MTNQASDTPENRTAAYDSKPSDVPGQDVMNPDVPDALQDIKETTRSPLLETDYTSAFRRELGRKVIRTGPPLVYRRKKPISDN